MSSSFSSQPFFLFLSRAAVFLPFLEGGASTQLRGVVSKLLLPSGPLGTLKTENKLWFH